MSNRSTNDTSHNINCKVINNLQCVIARQDSEIKEILIPKNTQESEGLIGELDQYCDKLNNIAKDNNNLYYSYIDDIYLKFKEKNKKDTNEYNIMNNYDIEFDSITKKTYLKNERNKFKKAEICNECFQLNKKIKLREDMLLIVLVKKEEKDNNLFLLIKEKKRDKNDKEKDEYKENYIPDFKYHVFYKKYNFRLEIPQVGQNFSSYLLKKNGKEEIILYLWSDKKTLILSKPNIFFN
jgi:hypothetical protein